MLKTLLAVLVVFIGSLSFVQTSMAESGSSNRTRIRLEARMRAGSTEAKVSFREESNRGTTRRWLEAEAERAVPNTTYIVFHNGKPVASFKTSAIGKGRVEIQRNVIVMNKGDKVAVGKMTGILLPRK